MKHKILIKIGDIKLKGQLGDSDTAKAFYKMLPVESPVSSWGDEFYFPVKISMDLDETATRVVNVGDIGYWPPDNAVCIFFGPTPASNGPEPVPASEVNIIGKIVDDPRQLKSVAGEKKIRIDKR